MIGPYPGSEYPGYSEYPSSVTYVERPSRSSCDGGVIAVIVIVVVLLIVAIVLAVVYGTRSYNNNGGVSDVEVIVVKDDPKGGPHVRVDTHGGDSIDEVSEEEAKNLLTGVSPVVVMIYATWCDYCKKMATVMEELSKEHFHVKIVKIENTKCEDMCKKNGVSGFPTLLTNFGDNKYVGYKPKDAMKKVLNKAKPQGGGSGGARFVHQKQHANAPQRGGVRMAPQEATSESQVRQLLDRAEPVLVFIYAEWCGYCRKAQPIMDELAAEQSNVQIVKINSDKCKGLCQEQSIDGFPTFLSNFGEKKYVGYKPKEGMMHIISQAMGNATQQQPQQNQHQHQHQQDQQQCQQQQCQHRPQQHPTGGGRAAPQEATSGGARFVPQQQQQPARQRDGGRAAPHEATSESEVRQLLVGVEPVLVFIYAEWCGYCRKAQPIMDELAAEQNNVKIVKINSDKCKALCQEQGIDGFPTFLSNFGEKKYVGYKPKEGMMQIVNSV